MRIAVTQLLIFAFFANLPGRAQDVEFARNTIRRLCSQEFSGRGYVNDGDKKAALFITDYFRSNRLQTFPGGYMQEFGFPVIFFPEKAELSIDDVGLVPGTDFIASAGCPVVKGRFVVLVVDSEMVDNTASFHKLQKAITRQTFLWINDLRNKSLLHPGRLKKVLSNEFNARGIIYGNQEKFTWSVHTEWDPFPVLYVKKNAIKHHPVELDINIDSKFKYHSTQNVTAFVKGKKYPDSFVVFTAHYDHLGMFGSAMFPGANDNASGIAMLLNLAKEYAESKPDCSVAFIAFAGEEAGLLGSYYYVQNPIIDLKKIKLLINIDLMATGDKGMTAVNGNVFKEDFQNLQLINLEKGYLVSVNPRDKAQNSDHFFFTEAGVKSFFFYLMGDYHFYHDPEDTAEAVTLAKYNEAFRLIREFADAYLK